LLSFSSVQSELPLVGNVAPDFEAEAVFDQEFIKVVCAYNAVEYKELFSFLFLPTFLIKFLNVH
jgi:peroxiredoxin (alkyl hydroperoxide reductase subunit C)